MIGTTKSFVKQADDGECDKDRGENEQEPDHFYEEAHE
jgi:hypothetical protein